MSAAAYVTSEAFGVSVGPPYQIALSTYPGTATGGVAFTTQPVVAVQDVGGNTVTTWNGGTISVAISDNPIIPRQSQLWRP